MRRDLRPTAASLACRIVNAYVGNNPVAPEAVLQMLRDLISASEQVGSAAAEPFGASNGLVPAVPIEDSVADDYLICLEDGVRFKSLKRHLGQKYSMTPDEYRMRWGLPKSYPMVAPAYAKLRSDIAKEREQKKREKQAAASSRRQPKSRRS